MNNVVGTLALKSANGSVIRTARYNTRQTARVQRDHAGNESYNRDGAAEYLKAQKVRWEASDQFIGTQLKIEEL